jgi:xylulokinase
MGSARIPGRRREAGRAGGGMTLLGIDIGTSGCKSAVFSLDGQMLSLAYEEYDTLQPQPGWAELDASQVWEQVKRTICKAAAAARSSGPIQALCVSSLGEAVVPVSARREILGPSLLNFDARGDEFLPGLKDSLSTERLYAINGNTPGSPYSLTKLKWMKQRSPDLYERAAHFLHWSGFVSFLLGAEARVDFTLANRTLLFDLQKENWSAELLDWAGLDAEKLPPTVPSGTIIGSVARSIAEELGIPAGIPIVSGGHDQCCNAVGCGVIEPGRVMYGMGTYLCAVPVFTRRPDAEVMIERGLNTEHHAAPGHFVSFIYNQGGILVKWFRDTFARAERDQMRATGQDIYPALLAEMPDGPGSVMVLPHFTMTGPPQFIQDSAGVIAGLKLHTSRGEILKGIVEATTFYLRESLETLPGAGIEITEFRAVGGGSKSDAWIQVCADILGRPFVRPRVNEAGALGAAILAGTGAGIFPSLQAGVEAMVQLEKEFTPDEQKHRVYAERFEHYARLGPLMREYLRDLA